MTPITGNEPELAGSRQPSEITGMEPELSGARWNQPEPTPSEVYQCVFMGMWTKRAEYVVRWCHAHPDRTNEMMGSLGFPRREPILSSSGKTMFTYEQILPLLDEETARQIDRRKRAARRWAEAFNRSRQK